MYSKDGFTFADQSQTNHDQDQRHEYHHLTRPFHMTLKMTTAQFVETSVTNNNSLPGDYSHLDHHNQHTNCYLVATVITLRIIICLFLFIPLIPYNCLSVSNKEIKRRFCINRLNLF